MGNVEESVLDDAEEVVVEEIVEEVSDEPKEPESIEESIKEAIKEIEGQESDGGEGEDTPEKGQEPLSAATKEVTEKVQKPTKKGSFKKEVDDDDVEVPEFLEPKHKALLSKLPDKELAKGLTKLVKHYEATKTRVTQEAAAAKREVSSLIDTVKPYIDQFTERNLTPAQGIGQLLVANKKLINTKDPDTQIEEAARIVLGCQIDPDALYARLTGAATEKKSAKVDVSTDPYVKSLEAKINDLTEKLAPVYNQHKGATDVIEESIFQKLQGVQLETDSDGNYTRPELAEDAQFLKIWKDLTSRLVKKDGIDWDEAGVKAYARLTGQAINKSPQSKIPNTNSINKRSVSAAVSVRGRTAPIANGKDDEDEVPTGETIEESIKRGLQSLR